jgi:hypothetical protein
MSRPYHGQGGYTVQPPQIIPNYLQWRIALHLSMVEFVIPKSKAIKK